MRKAESIIRMKQRLRRKYHQVSGLYHKINKKRNPKINFPKNKGPAKTEPLKNLNLTNKLELVRYTNAEIIGFKVNFNLVINKGLFTKV